MREYKTDGHVEPLKVEHLRIGTVIRMQRSAGTLPAFSDTVVTGIKSTRRNGADGVWFLNG